MGVKHMQKDLEDAYKGKNILSCKLGTRFLGSEIKAWIRWHLNHDTPKRKVAKQMERFLDIEDNAVYYLTKGDYKSSASYGKYLVVRA